jgi:hypothetical protein
MLISILTSDLTIVGLSVLEVSDCLLSHLLNSLKNGDIKFEQISINLNSKDSNIMTEKAQDLETMIVQRLITCIGNNIKNFLRLSLLLKKIIKLIEFIQYYIKVVLRHIFTMPNKSAIL